MVSLQCFCKKKVQYFCRQYMSRINIFRIMCWLHQMADSLVGYCWRMKNFVEWHWNKERRGKKGMTHPGWEEVEPRAGWCSYEMERKWFGDKAAFSVMLFGYWLVLIFCFPPWCFKVALGMGAQCLSLAPGAYCKHRKIVLQFHGGIVL